MLMQYAGATAPAGWLVCNGNPVSRSVYAELFGVIGTTYGNGDGATTFNVPNFFGKIARGVGGAFALGGSGGSDTTTIAANNLPTHTHPITDPGHTLGATDSGHTHNVDLTGGYSGDTYSAVVSGNFQYIGLGLGGAGNRTSDPSAATTGTANVSNSSETTGITVDANVSTNDAISVANPYTVVNFIIKYTSQNL
jgi:microcystin-dependent protein